MASLHITKREPRYVVQELSGYQIATNGSGERGNLKTSFYILDLLDNARVVHTVENKTRQEHRSVDQMRRKAKQICRKLNHDYRNDLPDAG